MTDVERALRVALDRSVLVIDDLLNTYASEFCNPERVAQARIRIRNKGGTLAYIANVQEQNRAALSVQVIESRLTTNCGDCGANAGEFCKPDCPSGREAGYREVDALKKG